MKAGIAAAAGLLTLLYAGEANAQSKPVYVVRFPDKTYHINVQGASTNISQQLQSYQSRLAREIQKANAKMQSRPRPQPPITIKIYR